MAWLLLAATTAVSKTVVNPPAGDQVSIAKMPSIATRGVGASSEASTLASMLNSDWMNQATANESWLNSMLKMSKFITTLIALFALIALFEPVRSKFARPRADSSVAALGDVEAKSHKVKANFGAPTLIVIMAATMNVMTSVLTMMAMMRMTQSSRATMSTSMQMFTSIQEKLADGSSTTTMTMTAIKMMSAMTSSFQSETTMFVMQMIMTMVLQMFALVFSYCH